MDRIAEDFVHESILSKSFWKDNFVQRRDIFAPPSIAQSKPKVFSSYSVFCYQKSGDLSEYAGGGCIIISEVAL